MRNHIRSPLAVQVCESAKNAFLVKSRAGAECNPARLARNTDEPILDDFVLSEFRLTRGAVHRKNPVCGFRQCIHSSQKDGSLTKPRGFLVPGISAISRSVPMKDAPLRHNRLRVVSDASIHRGNRARAQRAPSQGVTAASGYSLPVWILSLARKRKPISR